jgi:hypothetical protein
MTGNKNLLTMSSFTAMFLLGVGTAVIGTASRNIGLSPDQIGLLLDLCSHFLPENNWRSSKYSAPEKQHLQGRKLFSLESMPACHFGTFFLTLNLRISDGYWR